MDRRVKAAISILRQLVNERHSVPALARQVNLSPSRLRQLFNVETGQSPMQCLRNLRIQRAKALLRNTFLSVKEVAFRSGAKSVSHFSREFKKQSGLTPSDFRRRGPAVNETVDAGSPGLASKAMNRRLGYIISLERK
jgi:AraC family transcriptional regulator of arabinose operon